jgi:hypothetical protein
MARGAVKIERVNAKNSVDIMDIRPQIKHKAARRNGIGCGILYLDGGARLYGRRDLSRLDVIGTVAASVTGTLFDADCT